MPSGVKVEFEVKARTDGLAALAGNVGFAVLERTRAKNRLTSFLNAFSTYTIAGFGYGLQKQGKHACKEQMNCTSDAQTRKSIPICFFLAMHGGILVWAYLRTSSCGMVSTSSSTNAISQRLRNPSR